MRNVCAISKPKVIIVRNDQLCGFIILSGPSDRLKNDMAYVYLKVSWIPLNFATSAQCNSYIVRPRNYLFVI